MQVDFKIEKTTLVNRRFSDTFVVLQFSSVDYEPLTSTVYRWY